MIWGATARIVSDLLDRVGGLLIGAGLDEEAGASAA
jgi:hypothetical protein